MLGLALPVLSGAALLGALTSDGAVYARAEAAAGVAPRVLYADPEPANTDELRVGLGYRLRGPLSTLTLRLEPRLYLRVPRIVDVNRPLAFVHFEARHLYTPTARLSYATSASVNYGELEFSSVRLALATPVSGNTLVPVITIFGLQAQTGLTYRVSERWDFGTGVSAVYTKSLTGTTAAVYPEALSLGVDFLPRYQIDPVTFLTIAVQPRFARVVDRPDWLSLPVQVRYEQQLDPRTTIEAGAGATAAKASNTSLKALPNGNFAITRLLHERRGARISNRIGALLDAAFDPTLGRVYPVAAIDVGLQSDFGPFWSLLVSASGSATVTRHPVVVSGVGGPAAGSSARANIAAGYHISDWTLLELGVRGTLIGPHWSQEWQPIDRQLWFYTAISGTFGLGPDDTGAWMR